MKQQNKFIKIIKIDVLYKLLKEYYGDEVIKICLCIRKEKEYGLIFEACNDYLRLVEY